jgi:hypothetical protein
MYGMMLFINRQRSKLKKVRKVKREKGIKNEKWETRPRPRGKSEKTLVENVEKTRMKMIGATVE